MTAQNGIFALGTPEHCFLELDLAPGRTTEELLRTLLAAGGLLTTGGGVNVTLGLRPELWEALSPGHSPADAASFDEPLVGPDGFTMPATQHDAWVWVAGGNRTAVFDNATALLHSLAGVATVASELTGWVYRHDRDLTGFIDGTENPSLLEAPGVAVVPEGQKGAGSSVLLFQKWPHDVPAWEGLSERDQELAIGRTKPDSVELPEDEMPETSHVSRTVLERDGEELPVFRRNVAYGGVTESGTVFVGFSQERFRLHEMLRRMTGIGGPRDMLTRFTKPVSGAYYTIPTVESLAEYAPVEGD